MNSGCANACTGEQGLKDAIETRKIVADKFSLQEHLVAVASTGVIGVNLPMEKMIKGIEQLNPGSSAEDAVDFQQLF